MINVRYLHVAETEPRLEVGRSRHALAKLRLLDELAMLGARLASRRQSLRKAHRRRGQVRASVHGGDNAPRTDDSFGLARTRGRRQERGRATDQTVPDLRGVTYETQWVS